MAQVKVEWGEAAKKRLQKATFFIRPLAKAKVEKAARAAGQTRITLVLLEQIKKREMGHATREATRETGHFFRDTAKEVFGDDPESDESKRKKEAAE